MPRAVFMFDYDGVIVDSLGMFEGCFLTACRRHGYEQFQTREDFLRLFDTNMFDGMTAAGVPAERIDPLLVTMAEEIRRHNLEAVPFPGMADALAELATHAVLTVITSNIGSVVAARLHGAGIDGFDVVLGAETDRSKTRKIRRVLADHPEAAVAYYVGDTRGDVLEAHAADVQSVAVTWGWHSEATLRSAKPDHLVHEPADLLDLPGVRCL